MDREKQDMNIGIRRRSDTVSKERREHKGNDKKAGKITTLRNKHLQLNAEKSKMLCFRKEGGRRRRAKWRWKGNRIEEVTEFKYLGYVIKKRGDDGQIRELKNKGNLVMRRIWSLGERLFKDDFRRRMILFRYLVLGVIMYGAEIWGWKERGELEVIQKKYVKWSLSLDSCTPDYIVYKESGLDQIRITAVYRAMKFEEKALEGVIGGY